MEEKRVKRKKLLKKILIIVPSILVIVIIGRVVFVNIDQNREFNYHDTLDKSIKLWSNEFDPNGTIPIKNTGLSEELSPSLYWDNLPEGTKSLVITTADYDGPSPNFKLMTIDHFVVFNIDPTIDHIDEGISIEEFGKQGIDLGLNVNGEVGYVGPAPPMGTHDYYFRIYALSVPTIDLTQPTRADLMEKIKDDIIAYEEMIGTYSK